MSSGHQNGHSRAHLSSHHDKKFRGSAGLKESKLSPKGQGGDWQVENLGKQGAERTKNPFLRLREAEYTQMSANTSMWLTWRTDNERPWTSF